MLDGLETVLGKLANRDITGARTLLVTLQASQKRWNSGLSGNDRAAGEVLLGHITDAVNALAPSSPDVPAAQTATQAGIDAASGPPPGHVAPHYVLHLCLTHRAYCNALRHRPMSPTSDTAHVH